MKSSGNRSVAIRTAVALAALLMIVGFASSGIQSGVSPVLAGGNIYVTDMSAKTTVFKATADGYEPIGRLTIGPGGVLYGTTLWGGTSCPVNADRGCGTVFRLTPTGVITTLKTFYSKPGCNETDGIRPQSVPVTDADASSLPST